jgi:hypothetical protein
MILASLNGLVLFLLRCRVRPIEEYILTPHVAYDFRHNTFQSVCSGSFGR